MASVGNGEDTSSEGGGACSKVELSGTSVEVGPGVTGATGAVEAGGTFFGLFGSADCGLVAKV